MMNEIELQFIKKLFDDNTLFYKTKVKLNQLTDILCITLFSELGRSMVTYGGFMPFEHLKALCNDEDRMERYKKLNYPLIINEPLDIIDFINKYTTTTSFSTLEKTILDNYNRRKLIDISEEMMCKLQDSKTTIKEIIRNVSYKIDSIKHDTSDNISFLSGKDIVEAERRRLSSDEIVHYYETGFDFIDDYTNGLTAPATVFVVSPPKTGKAQTLDSIIYTPDGFIKMGDIKVGDVILNENGGTSNVTHIHPQGVTDVYRVWFNDKKYVDCNKEHLFTIKRYDNKKKKIDKWETLSVKDMINQNIKYSSGLNKFIIQTTLPTYFKERNIKINPYFLGAMISDGCFTQKSGLTFSNSEKDVVDNLKTCVPECNIIKVSDNDYYIGNSRDIINSLKEYNLMYKKSNEKFIPDDYKYNSLDVRLEIIRGLIDTDGCIEKGNTITYCTTSKRLASDIEFIIESLGGICKISTKIPKFQNGMGELCYILRISIKNDLKIFKSKKHTLKYKNRKKDIFRSIEKIEYIGKKETQCITVDNPTHLYLTNNFIVTHNSMYLYELTVNQLRKNKSVLFSTIEINESECYRKILSNMAQVDYHKIVKKNFSEAEKQRYLKALDELEGYKDNLFIIYDKTGISPSDIKHYYQNLEKVGIKCDFICIDYLGLLNSDEGDIAEVDKMTKLPRQIRILSQETNSIIFCPQQMKLSATKTDINDLTANDVYYAKPLAMEGTLGYFMLRDKETGSLIIKNFFSRIGEMDDVWHFPNRDFNKCSLGKAEIYKKIEF